MRYLQRISVVSAAWFIVGSVLLPAVAAAQAPEGSSTSDLRAAVSAIALTPSVAGGHDLSQPESRGLRTDRERPGALLPLYASLTALQALDVHSTSRGLAAGGQEANPVMQPIVKNRAAFIAVKAATTAGVVWASEHLWRRKNRKAAIVLTTLTNIGLAAVVAHNYRAAR